MKFLLVSVKIYIYIYFFISIHKNSNVLLYDNIHKYIEKSSIRTQNDEEKIYYFQ